MLSVSRNSGTSSFYFRVRPRRRKFTDFMRLENSGGTKSCIVLRWKVSYASYRCSAVFLSSIGDVSLSGEDIHPIHTLRAHSHHAAHSPPDLVDFSQTEEDQEEDYYEDDGFEEEEEEHHHKTSLKFLLAGGIAGAGDEDTICL